jgi:hypothetical protein
LIDRDDKNYAVAVQPKQLFIIFSQVFIHSTSSLVDITINCHDASFTGIDIHILGEIVIFCRKFLNNLALSVYIGFH